MPSLLLQIDEIDTFKAVGDVPAKGVSDQLIKAVRSLDEREELEPFVRAVLADTSDTPHGPAEIADILTHKLKLGGETRLSAFVLKGKSFPTVRPKHVSHQLYRLEKISGLSFAVFAASGTILDAAKEEFVSISERLNINYSIFDATDLARLFIAYGFLCPKDGGRISGGRCQCGYSPRRKILNVLQRETLRELEKAHKLGQREGLIILPTGSGKTRIAVQDSAAFAAKSLLYIAHTHEILDVAQGEFESVFGKDNVTRHSDKSSVIEINQINLATIQLMRNFIESFEAKDFDYVVIDEFHHAAANSYRRLLEHLSPDFLLGMTATPFRGDRQDIIELCNGNVLVDFELRTGIETGILAPYHYFGCFDDVDYTVLQKYAANYTIRDLEKALIIPERDAAIVQKWSELAADKPTLAFCCSHRHAHRVAEAFSSQGILAEVYLSSTRWQKRQGLIRRLEKGKLRILCTVDVLNEGADFPFIECLLFLRPTESKRIFLQQLGRGLRKYVGKPHCVVIDFIGNFRNAYRIVDYHGLLPADEDEAAYSSRETRNRKDVMNLPLGCKVTFEDKVIDIFAKQTLDPRRATNRNISRILIYHFERLEIMLGHRPSKKEVDRYELLGSDLYSLVFGSWKRFEELMSR